MPKLTGASFNAVKGVVLLGDPEHKAGLASNVDQTGGTSTLNVNGIEAGEGSIPSTWVSKTLDICWKVSATSVEMTWFLTSIQGRWCLRHDRWLRHY